MTVSDQPVIFLYTDQQVKDINRFCCNKIMPAVFNIDTTFNLGKFYVTVTAYENVSVIRQKTGKHPTSIGPIMIHSKKDRNTYYLLASKIRQLVEPSKSLVSFGTDDDPALYEPFQTCFPGAKHLLCRIHLKRNIERKLQELCITAKASTVILHDIFNSVNGLVNMTSEITFREKLKQCELAWISQDSNASKFVAYMHKFKVNKMISSVIGQNYTTNSVESVNSLLKRLLDFKKVSVLDFINQLRDLVKFQEKEIMRTLYNPGEFSISRYYSHTSPADSNAPMMQRQNRMTMFLSSEPKVPTMNLTAAFQIPSSSGCKPSQKPPVQKKSSLHLNDEPFFIEPLPSVSSKKRCKTCYTLLDPAKIKPPNDLCISHKERWEFPCRKTGVMIETKSKHAKMFYHLSHECLFKRFPHLQSDTSKIRIADPMRYSLLADHKAVIRSVLGDIRTLS